jgi:hypothetical protein
MRRVAFLCALLATAAPAFAQSLHLKDGQRAIEATTGWSVGPSSDGLESFASMSLNGRVDVGLGISRYTYTFDDGSTSTFNEYAPFVRVFLVKEQSGAPVSVAVSGQVFIDDYETDDAGHYAQVGTAIYKSLKLSDWFTVEPFVGFGFVAESYTFGDGPAERAQYLTRDLGLHFTTRADRDWLIRVTFTEQGFRRETYRSARLTFVRRL